VPLSIHGFDYSDELFSNIGLAIHIQNYLKPKANPLKWRGKLVQLTCIGMPKWWSMWTGGRCIVIFRNISLQFLWTTGDQSLKSAFDCILIILIMK